MAPCNRGAAAGRLRHHEHAACDGAGLTCHCSCQDRATLTVDAENYFLTGLVSHFNVVLLMIAAALLLAGAA